MVHITRSKSEGPDISLEELLVAGAPSPLVAVSSFTFCSGLHPCFFPSYVTTRLALAFQAFRLISLTAGEVRRSRLYGIASGSSPRLVMSSSVHRVPQVSLVICSQDRAVKPLLFYFAVFLSVSLFWLEPFPATSV